MVVLLQRGVVVVLLAVVVFVVLVVVEVGRVERRVRRMSESHVGGGWGWLWLVGAKEVEEEKGWVPLSHVNEGKESFDKSWEWGVGAWWV